MSALLSRPLVGYVLKAALRDRLIHALGLLIIVATSLALFLGGAAVTEKGQFALVFTAGGLRFAGVVGVVLFIVFYVRRSFDSKDVEYFLSRPLTRVSFLLSHAAAFSLLACLVSGLVITAVCLSAPSLIGPGYGLWALSFLSELAIMANAALFFSFVLTSPVVAALAVFALYVLARMMGEILGILDHHVTLSGAEILSVVMQAVSLIVPRLDLMAQTSWLVYGPSDSIGYGFILIHGIVYTLFLLAMALFDLGRRQF